MKIEKVKIYKGKDCIVTIEIRDRKFFAELHDNSYRIGFETAEVVMPEDHHKIGEIKIIPSIPTES